MLEAEIRNIVCNNPKLSQKFEVLTSIKGVGEKTALAILSDMPDVSCFQKSPQFAAFVGVTPSHKESGSSVKGASNISKIGAKRARKILYMSARKTVQRTFQEIRAKVAKSRKSTKNNHRRDYAKIDVPLLRPPQK